ncbi:MAG: DUF4272 domain-containing protein [Polyangiaceae bacterium]
MIVNAYATVVSLPELTFAHRLVGRRDRTDPDLVSHLNGFMGFVMDSGRRPMTSTRYGTLRHIERCKHHLAFEVDEDNDNVAEALGDWASDANAILLMQDGSILAPRGEVLVDPETGEPEMGAALPFPADAEARKSSTLRELSSKGIDILPILPPVVSEKEVELRAASEVAKRCLGLLTIALRAESLSIQKEISIDDLRSRIPRGLENLSPKEKAFLESARPDKKELTNFSWRYEAVCLLGWALGGLPTLDFPSTPTEIGPVVASLLEVDADVLIEKAELRATHEILDALDLHFRLHWATTQSRTRGSQAPSGLDGGVIYERLYALNWLTSFEDADWDDVTTPT